jgi:hypothetical protein
LKGLFYDSLRSFLFITKGRHQVHCNAKKKTVFINILGTSNNKNANTL